MGIHEMQQENNMLYAYVYNIIAYSSKVHNVTLHSHRVLALNLSVTALIQKAALSCN